MPRVLLPSFLKNPRTVTHKIWIKRAAATNLGTRWTCLRDHKHRRLLRSCVSSFLPSLTSGFGARFGTFPQVTKRAFPQLTAKTCSNWLIVDRRNNTPVAGQGYLNVAELTYLGWANKLINTRFDDHGDKPADIEERTVTALCIRVVFWGYVNKLTMNAINGELREDPRDFAGSAVIEFLHYQWPVRNLEMRGWKQKQTMFLSQLKCRLWQPPHCEIWFPIGVIIVSADRERESASHVTWNERFVLWVYCVVVQASQNALHAAGKVAQERVAGINFIDLVSLSNGSSKLIQLWKRWLDANCERNAPPTLYF